MSSGFNPFDPESPDPDATEIADAMADLDFVFLDIFDKIDQRINRDTETIDRVARKFKDGLATQTAEPAFVAPDSPVAMQLTPALTIDPTTPIGDDSELPCCEPNEIPNGDTQPNDTNGNGGGSVPNGNGGSGGDNGGIPDPFPCFDEFGNAIECPDFDNGGLPFVNIQTATNEVLKIPTSMAKAFVEQQQAEKLSLCPLDAEARAIVCDDTGLCCDDEPTNGQPACRICNDQPGGCPECPENACCDKWLCIINPDTCEVKVIPGDDELPDKNWLLLSQHEKESAANAACNSWKQACILPKQPDDENAIPDLTVDPCNEEFLKVFGSAGTDPVNFSLFVQQLILGKDGCKGPSIWERIKGNVNPAKQQEFIIRAILCDIIKGFSTTVDSLGAKIFGQNSANVAKPFAMEMITGFLSKWISPAFDRMNAPFNYSANWAAPTRLPDHNDAIDVFMANNIDQRGMEQWARLNGWCQDQFLKVAFSRQSLMSTNELIALRRRGKITKEDYERRHRAAGFVDPSIADLQFALSEQIPGAGSLIRYMARDVFDIRPNAPLNRFNLLQDFNNKFAGDVKRWSDESGLSTDQMKAEWAAHWRYPGFGQLIEMFHKLQFHPTLNLTQNDIRQTLIADDIPEFFVDRMIEATFKVPTRVDTRRMFDLNLIKPLEHTELLMRSGYSRTDADNLTQFAEAVKLRRLPTERPAREYRQGIIDRTDANLQLLGLGYEPAQITDVLDQIDKAFEGKTKLECTKSMKTRYLQGEFTKVQAVVKLQDLGWEPLRAQSLADRWECERIARPKLATVSTIRDLMEFDLIEAKEAVQRLINFGFTKDDAIDTASSIAAKLETKYLKSVAVKRDKIARELESAIKKREALNRKEEKSKDKESDDAEKEQKEADSRANKLTTAVGTHNAKFDSDFDETYSKAIRVRTDIIDDFGQTETASNDIVIQAIKQSVKQDIEDFEPLAREIAGSR